VLRFSRAISHVKVELKINSVFTRLIALQDVHLFVICLFHFLVWWLCSNGIFHNVNCYEGEVCKIVKNLFEKYVILYVTIVLYTSISQNLVASNILT
jgi:hypothetical protein